MVRQLQPALVAFSTFLAACPSSTDTASTGSGGGSGGMSETTTVASTQALPSSGEVPTTGTTQATSTATTQAASTTTALTTGTVTTNTTTTSTSGTTLVSTSTTTSSGSTTGFTSEGSATTLGEDTTMMTSSGTETSGTGTTGGEPVDCKSMPETITDRYVTDFNWQENPDPNADSLANELKYFRDNQIKNGVIRFCPPKGKIILAPNDGPMLIEHSVKILGTEENNTSFPPPIVIHSFYTNPIFQLRHCTNGCDDTDVDVLLHGLTLWFGYGDYDEEDGRIAGAVQVGLPNKNDEDTSFHLRVSHSAFYNNIHGTIHLSAKNARLTVERSGFVYGIVDYEGFGVYGRGSAIDVDAHVLGPMQVHRSFFINNEAPFGASISLDGSSAEHEISYSSFLKNWEKAESCLNGSALYQRDGTVKFLNNAVVGNQSSKFSPYSSAVFVEGGTFIMGGSYFLENTNSLPMDMNNYNLAFVPGAVVQSWGYNYIGINTAPFQDPNILLSSDAQVAAADVMVDGFYYLQGGTVVRRTQPAMTEDKIINGQAHCGGGKQQTFEQRYALSPTDAGADCAIGPYDLAGLNDPLLEAEGISVTDINNPSFWSSYLGLM